METINFVYFREELFLPTCIIYLFKRHVRETENILDDIILVDTPFKQA
jgi:hypothetical protein